MAYRVVRTSGVTLGLRPQALAGVAVSMLTLALRAKSELMCSSGASKNWHWRRPTFWVIQVAPAPRIFEFRLLRGSS